MLASLALPCSDHVSRGPASPPQPLDSNPLLVRPVSVHIAPCCVPAANKDCQERARGLSAASALGGPAGNLLLAAASKSAFLVPLSRVVPQPSAPTISHTQQKNWVSVSCRGILSPPTAPQYLTPTAFLGRGKFLRDLCNTKPTSRTSTQTQR